MNLTMHQDVVHDDAMLRSSIHLQPALSALFPPGRGLMEARWPRGLITLCKTFLATLVHATSDTATEWRNRVEKGAAADWDFDTQPSTRHRS